MNTSFKILPGLLRCLGVALAPLALVAGVAFAGIDMRIPKDSYLSAVIDLDAIRSKAPAIADAVLDGISYGRDSGNIRDSCAAAAISAVDKFKAWMDGDGEGVGVCASNLHWIVAEATNRLFWIQRDSARTQFVWNAVVAVDSCDWKQIESCFLGRRLRWENGASFGRQWHSVSWYAKNGYIGGSFGFLPDGDKTYSGQNVGRMWDAYHGMRELDSRPSRNGTLEKSEIVRVVLTSLMQVPKVGEIVVGFSDNERILLEGMSECCLSLFLADGNVGARLAMTFAVEKMAKDALAVFKGKVLDENGVKQLEESLAGAREKNDADMIDHYELLIKFEKGLRPAVNRCVFTIESDRMDMRRIFRLVALPIAEMLQLDE